MYYTTFSCHGRMIMFKTHPFGKSLLPSAGSNSADRKNKSYTVRTGIYLIILFVVLFAGYFVYDMSQARRMASDACILATQGMSLDDFLSKFPAEDYRIVRGSKYVIIVPKRGMGRNHCTVEHDGEKIAGSKAEFND